MIQDFILLREELGIIRGIITKQKNVLLDFCSVLKPESFEITSESRISSFQLESDLIRGAVNEEIKDDLWSLEEMIDRSHSLAEVTKLKIEIQQEDHGKAILVVTAVTTIFLPLSFTSSFFGMNTVDIRNSSSSQWLFWAISLPLTTIIVSLALVIAYRGERIREAMMAPLAALRTNWVPKLNQSHHRQSGASTSTEPWEQGDLHRANRHSSNAADMEQTNPGTDLELGSLHSTSSRERYNSWQNRSGNTAPR